MRTICYVKWTPESTVNNVLYLESAKMTSKPRPLKLFLGKILKTDGEEFLQPLFLIPIQQSEGTCKIMLWHEHRSAAKLI